MLALSRSARTLCLSPLLVAALGCPGEGGGGPYTSIPEQDAGHVLGSELCRLMLHECDCTTPQQVFFSSEHCTNAFADQLEMQFAEAKAAGLTYHPECMAEHVNFYAETVRCTTQSELTQDILTQLNAPSCKVHSGPGQAGDPCMPYYQALGDDCDVGLQCLGTCVVVPEIIHKVEGDPCTQQTDLCEAGTFCMAPADDPTGPTSCLRLPGVGQPCTVGCDVGLECEFMETQAVCVAPPTEGQPCGSYPNECAAGLWCNVDVCERTLPEGAPCSPGDDEACGVGFECDELDDGSGQDVCKPEEAFVCF